MDTSTKDWTYEDFKAFLLLYAAQSDFRITPEESAIINNATSGPRGDELRKIFRKNSDYENIQLILACKGRFFPTEAEKNNVLDEIRKLYEADEDVTAEERAIITVLQSVL